MPFLRHVTAICLLFCNVPQVSGQVELVSTNFFTVRKIILKIFQYIDHKRGMKRASWKEFQIGKGLREKKC